MNKKALIEKRNALKKTMTEIIVKAKKENRDLSSEDVRGFDAAEAEIRNINLQLETIEKNRKEKRKMPKDKTLTDIEKRETAAFASFLRKKMGVETRDEPTITDVNLTKGENGIIMPKTIVAKLVKKIEDISPVYQLATKYDAPGTIIVPLEDNTTSDIDVGFQNEFDELLSTSNRFASIELTGFLYGALTKISRSLMNNSDFNIIDFVLSRMATKIAAFIEGNVFNGTTGKCSGIAGSYDSANMSVTFATSGISADKLIDIQELIPDAYTPNCIWVMNRATRKAIRKLKDGQGNYLLEKDSNARWGYMLMGAPVYVSDNVPAFSANGGKISVFYGDFSGVAIKESEKPEIQILLEKFATQHAVGVVAWGELDTKVENKQKIACGINAS